MPVCKVGLAHEVTLQPDPVYGVGPACGISLWPDLVHGPNPMHQIEPKDQAHARSGRQTHMCDPACGLAHATHPVRGAR